MLMCLVEHLSLHYPRIGSKGMRGRIDLVYA